MNEIHPLDMPGVRASIMETLGVTTQAISNWKSRCIPAEYCPRIEALTGIRCEDLRPDVQWSVLRNTAPTQTPA